MKHLGKIEIGGSLDITNNKHVEDLIEETLKGIDIPEDTNTTYTLTQDGLTIQLVDGDGATVSEIVLPEHEDTNTTYALTNDGTTIQLIDDSGTPSTVDLTPLLPEDTNTTYSLTQDGTIIKLVDGDGGTASEVDLAPLLPDDEGGGDPYQEEKEFTLPPVNLHKMIRDVDYSRYEFTLEHHDRYDWITIYLHLHSRGVRRTFRIAHNANSKWTYYKQNGDSDGEIIIENISTTHGGHSVIIEGTSVSGSKIRWQLSDVKIELQSEAELNRHGYGLVLSGWQSDWGFQNRRYFVFPNADNKISSEPTVITGTLEEHLQNIYGYIHQ